MRDVPRFGNGRYGSVGITAATEAVPRLRRHWNSNGDTVTAREGQAAVTVIPTTLPLANRYVSLLHRHHAPIPGGFGWFCVAAVVGGTVRGVAIAGRPTNRNNDDGQTVEVLRLAADGTPNVPSALLGSCARASRAIGASRIITYTLASEAGASLRGAGWEMQAEGIQSWWTHPGKDGNGRIPAVDREHMAEKKARWGLTFREPVAAVFAQEAPADGQGTLDFGEGA